MQRVGVNLADAKGGAPSWRRCRIHRVLVLTEGVVPYLTQAQVGELAVELKRSRASRSGSPSTTRHMCILTFGGSGIPIACAMRPSSSFHRTGWCSSRSMAG
jgi:hypothetical protein